MTIKRTTTKLICILSSFLLSTQLLLAHNGTTGYAYPLGKITVDGDFSDWPATAEKYPIAFAGSDERPKSDADFSGFFQVGYRADERAPVDRRREHHGAQLWRVGRGDVEPAPIGLPDRPCGKDHDDAGRRDSERRGAGAADARVARARGRAGGTAATRDRVAQRLAEA